MNFEKQQNLEKTAQIATLASQYEKNMDCFENLKCDVETSNNEKIKLQSEVDKMTDEKHAIVKELALKESEIIDCNNKLAALTEKMEEKTSETIQLKRDIGMYVVLLVFRLAKNKMAISRIEPFKRSDFFYQLP